MDIHELATAIKTDASDLRIRQGKVTLVSPLTVTIAGSTSTVVLKRLASYTPTLNDVVWVMFSGRDGFVLGKLA